MSGHHAQLLRAWLAQHGSGRARRSHPRPRHATCRDAPARRPSASRAACGIRASRPPGGALRRARPGRSPCPGAGSARDRAARSCAGHRPWQAPGNRRRGRSRRARGESRSDRRPCRGSFRCCIPAGQDGNDVVGEAPGAVPARFDRSSEPPIAWLSGTDTDTATLPAASGRR